MRLHDSGDLQRALEICSALPRSTGTSVSAVTSRGQPREAEGIGDRATGGAALEGVLESSHTSRDRHTRCPLPSLELPSAETVEQMSGSHPPCSQAVLSRIPHPPHSCSFPVPPPSAHCSRLSPPLPPSSCRPQSQPGCCSVCWSSAAALRGRPSSTPSLAAPNTSTPPSSSGRSRWPTAEAN